jgi:hypothetical protein
MGKFSLFREIVMRNLREIYKMPCKRAAVFTGTLLRSLERFSLLGPLRAKENAYLCSSFLDPENVKI